MAAQDTSRRVLRLERAESVTVRAVSGDFFEVLRRTPALGRAFAARDEHGPCVVMLSDSGWTRLLGADPPSSAEA